MMYGVGIHSIATAHPMHQTPNRIHSWICENKLGLVAIFAFGFHLFVSPMIPNIMGYTFLRHCGTVVLICSACICLRPRQMAPFAFWIGWAGLTCLLGAMRSGLLPNFASVATLLGWFPAVYVLSRNATRSSDLLFRKVYILFCLVSSIIAIDQFYALTNIGSYVAQITEYNEVHTEALLLQSYNRVVGFCGNPNQMAYLSCIGIVALYSSFIRNCSSFLQGIYLVAFMSLAMSIIFTYSRTGVFTLIVTILMITIFALISKRNKRSIKLVCIHTLLIALLCVLCHSLLSNVYDRLPIVEWVDRAYLSLDAMEIRYSIWQDALDVLEESPIIGYGFGSLEGLLVVDNEALYVLRNAGIIGLLIFILTFNVLPLLMGIRVKVYGDRDYSLWLGLIVLMVFGLTAAPLSYVAQSGFVAWLWGANDIRCVNTNSFVPNSQRGSVNYRRCKLFTAL